MTKAVTARLFDSYGNPWLLPNGEPLVAHNVEVCKQVLIPCQACVCGAGFGALVFDRIHLDDHEAWYQMKS